MPERSTTDRELKFLLDADQFNALETIAQRRGVTVEDVIVEALGDYVADEMLREPNDFHPGDHQNYRSF